MIAYLLSYVKWRPHKKNGDSHMTVPVQTLVKPDYLQREALSL
jgi:hypothetical protein